MLVFIFQERFRRMMATHEEFQMLPNQTKLQICQKNLPMAAALTMAKLESCATGLDQICIGYGEWDRKNIGNSLAKLSTVSVDDIEKVTFAKINKMSKQMPPFVERAFYQLVNEIGDLVKM